MIGLLGKQITIRTLFEHPRGEDEQLQGVEKELKVFSWPLPFSSQTR